jgi:hypothetical protein
MSYAGNQSDGGRPALHGRRTVARALPAISAALVLSLTAVALAVATPVVAPRGNVAGKGYAYWQERFWQNLFASGRLTPKACQTLTVGGQRVALLTVGIAGPGPYSHTCTEPAGRPLYLQALTDECSTFKTDHNGFGTTASQLKRCARADYKVTNAEVWVDGRPVQPFNRFITATGVYPVHVPSHNMFNIKRPNGRSAAYGSGLLLSGLNRGTHTIWVNGSVPSVHVQVAFTYTLNVH